MSAVIDLTLTEPSAIVHAVADHLAGRRIALTWANLDGVWHGPAAVLGCVLVDDVDPVVVVALPTDDGQLVETGVSWHDLLAAGPDGDVVPPVRLVKRIVTASRWFGHCVEITQRDGACFTGVVVGFELSLAGQVDVILLPADRDGRLDAVEHVIAFDAIAAVLDVAT